MVIGVASTAPGYSLAAVLTLVVAAVGLQAPAILILAFLPMLFIAASYYYMNLVGSYGEPPLKGALIGSTAHKLLHLSERPVLVVRAAA